jgi:hypothetical protein
MIYLSLERKTAAACFNSFPLKLSTQTSAQYLPMTRKISIPIIRAIAAPKPIKTNSLF